MTLYEALYPDELDAIYAMFSVDKALPCRVRSISVSSEMPTQRNDKSLNLILAKKASKSRNKSSSLESLKDLKVEVEKSETDQLMHLKKLQDTPEDADDGGFVTSRSIKAPKIHLFDPSKVDKQRQLNATARSAEQELVKKKRFENVKSKLADYLNDRERPQVSRSVKRVRKAKSAIDVHYYTASSYLYYKDRVDADSYLKLNSQLEQKIRDDRGKKLL